MRVLLVEDEAPLRETLAARLKRDGFAVDAAGELKFGAERGLQEAFGDFFIAEAFSLGALLRRDGGVLCRTRRR